jgi:hypothetical protein
LSVYDARLINNGVRNPQYAIANCPPNTPESVWPYNDIDADEALEISRLSYQAKVALTGADGESAFYANVGIQHPERREGRSKAYRPCLTEHFRFARWLTDGCKNPDQNLAECEEFNSQAEANGVVARLDGVKGACEAMLQ